MDEKEYLIHFDEDAFNEKIIFADNQGYGYELSLLDVNGIKIKTHGEIRFELINSNEIRIYSDE